MSSLEPQVVHEKDAQRQHIRVSIPAQATIGSKDYDVHDISMGGLRLKNVSDIFKKDQKFDCVLAFPFEGFTMQVSIPCSVEQYDPKNKTLGCVYRELTAAQLSILNLVIKSYVAGTLITEDDVLHVAGRDNSVKFRSNPQNDNIHPARSNIKRIVSLSLILLAGFLGLLFILGNVYESVSILKSYQGVVQADIVISRANADGEFTSLIGENVKQVSKGQPMAEISSLALTLAEKSGNQEEASSPLTLAKTTILSPCDCHVLHQFVNDGEFRALGESLFKLVPVDTHPWITATILPEEAQRLSFEDDARIRIAGETTFIEGTVINFNAANEDAVAIQVRVRPKEQLPNELIGRPAYVEFMVH